jgi:hypothetical protein
MFSFFAENLTFTSVFLILKPILIFFQQNRKHLLSAYILYVCKKLQNVSLLLIYQKFLALSLLNWTLILPGFWAWEIAKALKVIWNLFF